ncbi:MAG: hypothetical protein WAM44_13625 [Chthoniobacterales bacterium]
MDESSDEKGIAGLDADILWFPEKLEKQVAHMAQSGYETGLCIAIFTHLRAACVVSWL